MIRPIFKFSRKSDIRIPQIHASHHFEQTKLYIFNRISAFMNFGGEPPLVSLYVFSLLGQRIYGKNKHADFMKERKNRPQTA